MKILLQHKPTEKIIDSDDVKKVADENVDFEIVSIDGVSLIGFCKKCGKPVTSSDNYFRTNQGDIYLSDMI